VHKTLKKLNACSAANYPLRNYMYRAHLILTSILLENLFEWYTHPSIGACITVRKIHVLASKSSIGVRCRSSVKSSNKEISAKFACK